MKRIILCLSLFAFFGSQAQQINPVPDYVFSNKMSVGRNAVTDTAAYFSIGPRYGAVRGFMPPMVTDTATITTGKRNGLTIFSIQKNKYMYWDSVRVQWSDFAGSSGAYIFATDTASMLSPYIRAAGNGLTKSGQSLLVDTAVIATRARVQKAVDSINTNVALKVNISDTASMLTPYTRGSGTTNYLPKFTGTRTFGNSVAFDNGGTELLVNTTTDAGAYALQVAGAIYNTTGGALAVSSGDVGIGTTLPNRSGVAKALSINADNVAFELNRGDVRTALIYTEGTTVRFNSVTNIPLHFGTNNIERVRITTDGNFGINTTNPSRKLHVVHNAEPVALFSGIGISTDQNNGGAFISVQNTNAANGNMETFSFVNSNGIASSAIMGYNVSHTTGEGALSFVTRNSGGTFVEGFRLSSSQELLIGTTTDAGAYALQVAGVIYTTNDAYFGASSGRLGVGTTTPAAKITSIQSGVVTATNSAFWASHDASANPLDGIGIGTNGNSSYKWIQTYGGALSLNSAGNDVLINTTTDAGAYNLQVAGAIYNTTTITTGAPTGGSIKPWRLGEAATVSPTSPNRTIRVEIDGTVYYIHAKTTND